MSVIDPTEVAAEAGLRHVDPSKLPIVRRRAGSGFTYVDRDGRRLTGGRRNRIESLAIPPAWVEVRVAADHRAHIQAVGVDDRGRTQYRYHDAFREAAETAKFARLGDIARALPRLRRRLADEVAAAEGGEDGDLALVIALIDATLVRVGTPRYVDENDSFGASTLLRRHVTDDAAGLRLRFVSKGGAEHCLEIPDCNLADAIRRRSRGRRDDPLFVGPGGGTITGSAVADALSDWSGVPMSAKDLRTWGATAAMVGELLEPELARQSSSDDPVIAAYDGVAARLGNTRDIARSSYVAPDVVDAYDEGVLAALWARSRRSDHFTRPEQCARKLFVG